VEDPHYNEEKWKGESCSQWWQYAFNECCMAKGRSCHKNEKFLKIGKRFEIDWANSWFKSL